MQRSGVKGYGTNTTAELLAQLTPLERAGVEDIFRSETDRGWIPRRSDIEAAIQLVRLRQLPLF